MGARCYKVGIYSFVADNIFFLINDVNDHLWMTFGKGKDLRWIPIHDIVRSLGPRSKAVPFFHAFTGCDTVSAFVGKGKDSMAGLECV
jgi:hypothetical protein